MKLLKEILYNYNNALKCIVTTTQISYLLTISTLTRAIQENLSFYEMSDCLTKGFEYADSLIL